jgi:hypothetical protein
VALIVVDNLAKCQLSTPMITHPDIIRILGGCKQVAAELGIESANTVLYWTRRGRSIPPDRWHQIAQLPASQTHGITVDALAAARAPRKQREAA